MCAGAIINSRLKKVVFGAFDSKAGACDSVINLFSHNFNHKPEVWAGILEQDCSKVLSDFFKKIR
jgi:tRNA(adenine34) deaminase